MLMNMGLDKQGVFLGIQAAGNILGQLLEGVPPQVGRVLTDRNGVHVRHKIIAVKFLGQIRPVFDGTEIGTQSQIAAGLNTGEQDFLFFHL